jgi:hypothetical protein
MIQFYLAHQTAVLNVPSFELGVFLGGVIGFFIGLCIEARKTGDRR